MPKLTAIRKQALDEAVKTALFAATVAVLAEHGVDGMTMDRVAAAAGVAKGSLYHYFRSKQDLLEFVYAKIMDPIFRDLEEIVASERPAVEKLATHLEKLLEHIAKHSRVFKLLFQDDRTKGRLEPSQRRMREAAGERLGEVFRQGMAEGVFRPADPVVLTHMFIGLCGGVFDTRPALEEREQRQKVQHLIMHTFLNGIAAAAYGAADCRGGDI
jgi:AcrR family transcriptional regulator